MRPFEYVSATTLAEARSALNGRADARYLAGGTTLVDLMKGDVERPSRVVDISALPLADVRVDGDVLHVGALARNSDVAYHPLVERHAPALSEALLSGASGQLRNMATVGGNVLQRTRCPYFRETAFRCNKREPGSGCDAREGFHRSHAILGTSESCIATYPGDMSVALVALDAWIVLETAGGTVRMPLEAFFLLPGDTPEREHAFEHGDIIVGIEVPLGPLAARSHYLKLRDRASYEFALVSVACAAVVGADGIAEARIALGGVGTVPWRARDAEAALAGAPLDAASVRGAASIALNDARPLAQNAFKIELAERAIARAFEELAERAA